MLTRERGKKEVDEMPSMRQRNGKWMVLYRDHEGTQRSAGSCKTKAEANKLLAATKDGQEPPEAIKGYYTSLQVGSYAGKWLAGHQIESATVKSYQASLRNWIIPYFGHMNLSKITKADVRAWVKWMQSKDAGAPAIHKAWVVASAMFTTALTDGLIGSHPCKGVKLPPVATKIRHVITKGEFDRLLRQIPSEYRPLVQVAIGTGCRWGECIALNADDLDGDFLNITRAISYGKVKNYPKNTEHRRIKVTPEVAEIIRGYPDYSRLDPNNFRSRFWVHSCERAGLRNFTFHDLRHTHASWLLANGCDIQTLKERLGHHDLKTTQRYLHTLPTSQDAALTALERAMAA